MSDALTLEGVHAFYGDSHVLQDVSFTLAPGQLLALLGRNGAGKTTCISTIVGMVAARHGAIRLFGESIVGCAPEAISHMGVGLVPQGRRVFHSLSVRENLMVARQREGESAKPWTIDRVCDLFPRLRERQNQTAGSLSGGEQQMLAIARALMGNPRVLLMDEPSEGLAPLIVAEVARIIARLRDEGQTIVLVEQNSKMALAIADSVAILTTGRCVFQGAAAELRADDTIIAQNLGVFHGHG